MKCPVELAHEMSALRRPGRSDNAGMKQATFFSLNQLQVPRLGRLPKRLPEREVRFKDGKNPFRSGRRIYLVQLADGGSVWKRGSIFTGAESRS
jgi:hypothetical protein